MIEGERLLQAVRNRLRDNLSNVAGTTTSSKKQSIQIMPNELIPPKAGEEFIGIFGVQVRNLYPVPNNSTKESYEVSIGITRRIQAQPPDRLGDTIYTEDIEVYNRVKPSMLARAREIIDLIDGEWQVIVDTNTLISDGNPTSTNCFITPLGLLTADVQPKYVDENHFFTPPDSVDFHKGLFMEIAFGGAEFIVAH